MPRRKPLPNGKPLPVDPVYDLAGAAPILRALHDVHGCVGLMWRSHHRPACRVIVRPLSDLVLEADTMMAALQQAAERCLPPAVREELARA